MLRVKHTATASATQSKKRKAAIQLPCVTRVYNHHS